MDTACARLALGQNSIPPALEEATRMLDDIAVQKRVLRSRGKGADHSRRLADLEKQREDWESRKKELE